MLASEVVRGCSAILGVLVVLANVACVALCGFPRENAKAAPPCHQQKQTVKACSVHDFAGNATKIVVELPQANSFVVLVLVSPPRAAHAAMPPEFPPSPPLALRI
jgi:hypothetical protein